MVRGAFHASQVFPAGRTVINGKVNGVAAGILISMAPTFAKARASGVDLTHGGRRSRGGRLRNARGLLFARCFPSGRLSDVRDAREPLR